MVMMSFTFSTNKISGIWPTPNPEKANLNFSQSECFKVTKGLNYLLIDYRVLPVVDSKLSRVILGVVIGCRRICQEDSIRCAVR